MRAAFFMFGSFLSKANHGGSWWREIGSSVSASRSQGYELPAADDVRGVTLIVSARMRYVIVPETKDILITRLWHGREAQT
jgi:hypothetical protein